MGEHVNRLPTNVVAVAIAALISALNVFLLAQAVGLA
jgi:Mn2+/Fe2+ NRAMP family transporter